jgi:DNA polymerase elongation subunit (family B)
MYQSIYYSYSGNDKGTCYVRDSKKGWLSFKYYPQVYKLNPEGEYTTLFGDKCSPIQGKYDFNDPTILEKDLQKELAVLRDLYYKTDNPPDKHNTVYLDIEIEILGALTPQTIREANAKITSIALIDTNTNKKYCWILDEKQTLNLLEQNNIQIISCISEKTLLHSFLDKWMELDPTIVVGYNSDFFDIPYLYFRIKKILGEDMVLYLSPLKKINDNMYNSYSPITIGGINSLDYMLLIKKYITKEEPSYKLNDIGIKYAGLGKIEYNGSLDTLYKEDPIKFIEYNLRDVEIIGVLEEKLQFIQLTILICHLCGTPYEMVYYNTMLNEGAILKYLKRKNIVSPNKPTTTNKSIKELNVGDEVTNQRGTPTVDGIISYIDEKTQRAQIRTKSNTIKDRSLRTIRKKEGYAGGYLLDIEPNLYDWVIDNDYSSLYPSIIRSLNLSIETLVGRLKVDNPNYNKVSSLLELKKMNPTDKITIEFLNKKTYTLSEKTTTVKKLIKTIYQNNFIIAANGTIFDSSKKSIIAEILTDWFNLRTQYKNEMKKAYKRGDKEVGVLYDQKQHSIKILLNSVYGTLAINSWRYTDGYKICSSAITNTGQRFVMETLYEADRIIKKDYIDNGNNK